MLKKLPYLFLLLFFSNVYANTLPSNSKIQGRLNIVNGASAECVMHRFYTNSGWTQVEGKIGRGGFDGLYYKTKNGAIRDVLVSESKWNTSRLGRSGKNRAVLQMSQEWVLRTINKLLHKMDTHTYRTVKQFVLNDQYRARLFRLKPVSGNRIQITIYKIKNKGMKAFSEIIDTQLPPISLNAPKNSFERGVISAYNDCRREYLRKYLGFLTEEDISILLQDNYIQKKDIKRLMQ